MSGPFARLLVDTACAPRALGQRGTAGERQLVYRCDGLQLDVMLQSVGAATTFVWGQLSHATSGKPCASSEVTLLDEDSHAVAQSSTDAFGEFSFASPRIVEGVLAVRGDAHRFRCWLAQREAGPSVTASRGPTA